MEIYLDVLFLENLVMNYLILQTTAKFSKTRTTSLRLFIGALIGALYVMVLVLMPNIKLYYTTAGKIALSLFMVAITFYPYKVSSFIKILAVFYASSFVFAGGVFAFLYFSQSGSFVKNGVFVFWERKWIPFMLAVITIIIIGRIFWDMLQYKFVREKLLIPLKISFENRIVDISALVDTGNSLHDPLSNMPVIVVEFMAIKHLLPSDICNIFETYKENDLSVVTSVVSKSSWQARFRLIPFTSLGKENGMLIGFKPDYIEIGEEDEKRDFNNVIVGIYNKALSKNEKYKALLNPELVT